MTSKTLYLTDSIYHYLCAVSLRENHYLQQLREETAKLANSIMQISPAQGQFMALLVELIGAKNILEIGTFTGYSSLAMAQALPDNGYLMTCDINPEWTQIARQFWQVSGQQHKIDLRLAPALDTLRDLLKSNKQSSFDLIFIDADKINYPHYYEQALLLARTGGLIIIDNVLWYGKLSDNQIQDKTSIILRELNAFIHKDERVSLSIIPIGDGMTLARKR